MKKRFLLVGALATTLTFGGLFTPRLVHAATTTTQAEVENNDDYYVLPNGEHFLTKRTLKNGKTLEFYDISVVDSKGEFLKLKAKYDGEEFQYDQLYVKDDTQVKQLETYFPALTATKKVNDLIQKYKDPSKSTLPESVDKTSELYLDMKSCADEAIKDCKTEYEKIVALDWYVHNVISYDYDILKGNSPHINLTTAWKEKRGVCENFADIMQRLCQIEGIPSAWVAGKNHACTLSYDSQNKKWIYSDPTGFSADISEYGRANQLGHLIENVNSLKIGDNYFSLIYDKTHSNKGNDFYDHWDEMENWTLKLQGTASPNLNLTQTELDGIPITEVDSESLRNNTEIKSVTLPSSITDVGYFAFTGCTNLEEVDLSQTKITSIPNGLFDGCKSLKTVKLPSTVTSIGKEAFNGCTSLTNIEGLDKCKLASIGTNAFYNCARLQSLDFSQATFTSIDDEMFYGLTRLKSITFPETLTTIGKQAFAYTALAKADLPASLTTIGEQAFYYCTKLESIDLSKTQVKEIPSSTFTNCSALAQIDFPSTLTTIGESAFTKCTSVTKLDLSNTALTTVGDYAFSSMTELTNIALPESISNIGKDAFSIFNYSDIVPTLVSGNVVSKVGYTDDNTAPWRRRAVMFIDDGDEDLIKSVRFYGNGGSGTPVNPIFTTGNSRIKIPACTYTRSGYLFTGWNTRADGSGVTYKANYTTTRAPEKLYAQWKKSKCEITFVFTGGTLTYNGDEYEDTFTKTYSFSSVSSAPYVLPKATAMDRPGYTFLAWYKEEDFSGKPLANLTFDAAEDMTLYAKWMYNTNHTHQWVDGVCTICDEKCTHSNFRLEGEKEATCKDEGYSGDKVCSDCGLTFEKGHTIDKTDVHTWDERKVTKEPNCKEEGEIRYTCTVCGETKVEALAKTDTHKWGEWTTVTTSTCTKAGKEVRECEICGATESKELPLAQHTLAKEADKAATCTEAGYVGREYCSVCNATLKERTTIKATGHDWGEWNTTLAQTCTTDGEQARECKTCGETETEVIKATGHDTEIIGAKASTCTTEGYSGDEVCKACGKTIKKGEALPLAQHTPKKEEGVAATCTQDGHEGNTVCEVCGATLEEGKTIEKLGHDWANEKGECTRCGEKHEHSFGKGKVITELTCTQNGEIDYECNECGYVKKEITKTAGHQWGEWETTLAQTCTTDGEQIRKCSKCSEIETKTLKATGHETETVGAKAATCKEDGYTGDEKCKTCGEILNKGTTIPKTDSHKWDEWTTTRESTCDEKGEESRKCSICNKEEVRSLPLAKHVWGSGKVTKAPSYTKVGVKTWTCKNCGATKTATLAKLLMPKVGTKVTVGGSVYMVTRVGAEVRFSKANAKARTITVPSTIKVSGITYKVTSIGANAFKNCKKLTTVTIGTNVKSVAAKAFNNCPKLKKVTIKTALLTKKTASKKCFSKVNKKMVVKVPKKVKKAYAMIFKDLKVQ